MMNEAQLIEKLRLIETLHTGAITNGEKEAAANAHQRILDRLEAIKKSNPPVEYTFTMSSMWSRKLFVALLRRYGLIPYRYQRQRYTTVMVRVSEQFVDEVLWPQFEALDDTLEAYLDEVTERVIAESIHADQSDADVIQKMLNAPQSKRK